MTEISLALPPYRALLKFPWFEASLFPWGLQRGSGTTRRDRTWDGMRWVPYAGMLCITIAVHRCSSVAWHHKTCLILVLDSSFLLRRSEWRKNILKFLHSEIRCCRSAKSKLLPLLWAQFSFTKKKHLPSINYSWTSHVGGRQGGRLNPPDASDQSLLWWPLSWADWISPKTSEGSRFIVFAISFSNTKNSKHAPSKLSSCVLQAGWFHMCSFSETTALVSCQILERIHTSYPTGKTLTPLLVRWACRLKSTCLAGPRIWMQPSTNSDSATRWSPSCGAQLRGKQSTTCGW